MAVQKSDKRVAIGCGVSIAMIPVFIILVMLQQFLLAIIAGIRLRASALYALAGLLMGGIIATMGAIWTNGGTRNGKIANIAISLFGISWMFIGFAFYMVLTMAWIRTNPELPPVLDEYLKILAGLFS